MDRFFDRLQAMGDSFARFVSDRAERLGDPESMVAAFIMTVWTVLASMWGGWPVILIFLLITGTLHILAVESGNHVVLWLSTSALLMIIVIASQTVFGGLPPVLLAAAGTTALAHNELIRINYARRRNAVVHDAVFQASGLALTGAGVIGIVGVALAEIAAGGGERNWLWMPVAVGALMLIGFGLAIGPTRRATEASAERWQPGERIPPQPLGRDDIEHY
ncbi:MAG: hypothetical protein ACR2QK_24095 [Acidimicrobiales bacterium]